jgi:uncharacterized protein YbjT (DUF2867 family)
MKSSAQQQDSARLLSVTFLPDEPQPPSGPPDAILGYLAGTLQATDARRKGVEVTGDRNAVTALRRLSRHRSSISAERDAAMSSAGFDALQEEGFETAHQEHIVEPVRTYAVTAATGHVGGHTALDLLRAGHKVRVMARDARRLKRLEAAGAEICTGDLTDPDYVERGLDGVDGALLVVPPHPAAPDFTQFQIDTAHGYAVAAGRSGLRHAVVVSALGANDNRIGGLIEGHANIEAQLNTVPGLNLVHLQLPSYFEILYYFLQPLRDERVLRTPLGPDAALQLVAARDVATAAAQLLGDLRFRGTSIFPVHPIRAITLREISDLLTENLGEKVEVEQISAEADIDDLVAAGTGRSFAVLLNETWALATTLGQASQTGPEPATAAEYRIEDFIRDELVPAIRDDRPIADYSTATRPRRTA